MRACFFQGCTAKYAARKLRTKLFPFFWGDFRVTSLYATSPSLLSLASRFCYSETQTSIIFSQKIWQQMTMPSCSWVRIWQHTPNSRSCCHRRPPLFAIASGIQENSNRSHIIEIDQTLLFPQQSLDKKPLNNMWHIFSIVTCPLLQYQILAFHLWHLNEKGSPQAQNQSCNSKETKS